MKTARWFLAAALCGFGLATPAHACSVDDLKACEGKAWVVGEPETPIGERWWPNKLWGAGDEAGSTNWHARPEIVQRALAEARTGKTYRLGRPITEPGPAVTRLDGLGQLGVATGGADTAGRRYYNGAAQREIDGPTGLRKNGLEKLRPIVGRGILIDIAGAKGVPYLEAGTEITLLDVREALGRQGLADLRLLPGDVVLLRTGWGIHAAQDVAKFGAGEPGIGMEVARWLSDDVQAGLVGSDTWGLEAAPAKDAACERCIQQHLLVRHGIVLQHNLDLDALAADKAWRFLYLFAPVPSSGVAGASGSPVAVR